MKIIYSIFGTILVATAGLILVATAQPTYPSVGPIISIGGGGTSSGSGVTNLPTLASGALTSDGSTMSWSTGLSGTWLSAGSIPYSAADTSWAPLTNAIMSTNLTGSTSAGWVPISKGGTNGYGAQDTQFRLLEFTNLSFVVYTAPFTQTITACLVFTNAGIKYTIPCGTNNVAP
jgi:hypothetical protein